MSKRKVVFITSTRADFGKVKPLIHAVDSSSDMEAHIFATGMHMLQKYGSTVHEIFKCDFDNIYLFNNSAINAGMDMSLANTINGLSCYINELNPSLIVVHGDRPETLAGAIVGCFNNILVAHLEGGEISGTVDELIRHSVTKLAHIHFVSNETARARLIQMGETSESIFVIGSPDIDVMLSEDLPSLEMAKQYYGIDFDDYYIFIYHPVTTELDQLERNIKTVVDALLASQKKYIVIYPNNDAGRDIIFNEYQRLENHTNFRVIPSVRFEFFLAFLKHCRAILGNSSIGIREAGVYGVPSINIGTRQTNRSANGSIIHVKEDSTEIRNALNRLRQHKIPKNFEFGDGKSTERFMRVLNSNHLWKICPQKQFVDLAHHKFNPNSFCNAKN